MSMSGERKRSLKDSNEKLNELLNFGPNTPEVQATESAVSKRIKDLIKRLQEINERIDNLTNRP